MYVKSHSLPPNMITQGKFGSLTNFLICSCCTFIRVVDCMFLLLSLRPSIDFWPSIWGSTVRATTDTSGAWDWFALVLVIVPIIANKTTGNCWKYYAHSQHQCIHNNCFVLYSYKWSEVNRAQHIFAYNASTEHTLASTEHESAFTPLQGMAFDRSTNKLLSYSQR